MAIKEIKTEEEYKELVESGKLFVVDFWAPWCGPCRSMGTTFKKVAEEYEDKEIEFVKMNIDEEYPGQKSAEFGVRSIPALFLFKGEETLGQHVGMMPESKLKEFVDEHLE